MKQLFPAVFFMALVLVNWETRSKKLSVIYFNNPICDHSAFAFWNSAAGIHPYRFVGIASNCVGVASSFGLKV